MGFHYKSGSITYFEAFAASSKELCKALRDYPLILAFGWLDIKKKYNRSVLGPFWITLYMGIVIATLGVIFGQVLHLPLREYLPFLTLGYIIWGFIASVLKESCSVFAASEGIIKQLSLSPFFYLLRLFWRNLVIFFHNLLIFPLVCVVVSCPIEISSLLVIPGFIILCVNLFWLSIVISFLCARYTKEEIEKYFSPYLACAARALDLTRSELLGALMRHYDGFCFERSATERVFAPWSLLNFFASPRNGLLDYWFESGGKPSVLMEYLKSHAMRSPEEYGREKTISLSTLSGSSDADTLSDLGLLTQTGYLTIKAVKYGDTVYLDYPNLEVKKAMGQLYVEHLLTGRSAGQVGAGPIVQVLSEESAEALVHILNRLFAAIDYQRYPVRDEASVRAFTQVYFAGAGLEPKVEHHTAHGRSDLEVKVNNRHWILEFKVSRDQENPDQKLEEAVEQLKLKGYGDDSSSENLIKVALVFSLEERKFIRWKEV